MSCAKSAPSLRMLLLAGAVLLLAQPAAFCDVIPGSGTCSGTGHCSGLSQPLCPLAPGCSWLVSGSCSGSSQCWNVNTGAPCTCGSNSDCQDYQFWCCGTPSCIPYNCCSGSSPQSNCERTDRNPDGVVPCVWSSSGSCTGTFTGACSDYTDNEEMCAGLGCTWTPTAPSCLGNSCTQNFPPGCCVEAPVCADPGIPPRACDNNAPCLDEQPGAYCNVAAHQCVFHNECSNCIPLGGSGCSPNGVQGNCCANLVCAGGTCACRMEGETCSGAGQGNCCSSLRCISSVCRANRAPARPDAPVIQPGTILTGGTVACALNCPPDPLPVDPDSDPVAMGYQWYVDAANATAWGSETSYACSGCSVGSAITMRSRACDSRGACNVSDFSNQALVVEPPAPPPPGPMDVRYMILALIAAFSILALAYMATYLFELM
ncbi:Uncharacterised protein [Candidatus Burarchaeum australiense]|nr:Uncharacterised protein [Candidatus Burarchaeum australiense]